MDFKRAILALSIALICKGAFGFMACPKVIPIVRDGAVVGLLAENSPQVQEMVAACRAGAAGVQLPCVHYVRILNDERYTVVCGPTVRIDEVKQENSGPVQSQSNLISLISCSM